MYTNEVAKHGWKACHRSVSNMEDDVARADFQSECYCFPLFVQFAVGLNTAALLLYPQFVNQHNGR